MDLRGYFQLLLRRWPILLVTVVVAVGIGYVTTDRAARYQSTATLLVSPERFDLATEGANVSLDRITVIDRLLLTYSKMIQSDTGASGAAARLNLDRSTGSIIGATVAAPVPQTQLLQLTITDSDPTIARDLTNAVAQSFIDAVNSTSTSKTTGAIPGGVPVTIFETAHLPIAPLPNQLVSNLILAAVFGLLLASGACIAADAFDLTVRSVRDTERRLGLPVVGTIPTMRDPSQLDRRDGSRRSAGANGGARGPTEPSEPAEELARA
jgi:capsular polysaccharide biosynthesis protein